VALTESWGTPGDKFEVEANSDSLRLRFAEGHILTEFRVPIGNSFFQKPGARKTKQISRTLSLARVHVEIPDRRLRMPAQRWVPFVWAILLEEHANQLISGDWNNQKNGANHANHEHPAQNMSHSGDQRIEHFHAPVHIGGILPLSPKNNP